MTYDFDYSNETAGINILYSESKKTASTFTWTDEATRQSLVASKREPSGASVRSKTNKK